MLSPDKPQSFQAKATGGDQELLARRLTLLARDLRNFLSFHQQLGIDVYPASDGLTPRQSPAPERVLETGGSTVSRKPDASRRRPQKKEATPVSARRESVRTVESVVRDSTPCPVCGAVDTRLQSSLNASGSVKLMIVGDYCCDPSGSKNWRFGEQEDQMLGRMVEALGLGTKDVFITNCLQCRCTGHRAASGQVMERSRALLSREILAVRPKVICAMGAMAGQILLGCAGSVSTLRGRFHPYRYGEHLPVQVMVTYHPRFLLAHPEMKRASWSDLLQVQGFLKR